MTDSSDLEERLAALRNEALKPVDVPKPKKVKPVRYGPTLSERISNIDYGKIIKYGVGVGAVGATAALSYYFKDQIMDCFNDQIMNYFLGQVIRHKEGIMFGGISGFVGGCVNGARWFPEVDMSGKEKLKFLLESVASGIVSGSLMQYLCGVYPPEFEVTASIIALAGVSTYFLIPYLFVGVERLFGSDKWTMRQDVK